MAPNTQQDEIYMQQALILARRGLGLVAPNPSVGCVIVKANQLIGVGHTQAGGRPHAETIALSQAGADASGATAYVTLEPCAHQGQTGPCSEALIKAGIKTVIVAMIDPDSRVSGRGLAMLDKAGIEVMMGVLEAQARGLNKGFIFHRLHNRPMVTLKIATSANGMMQTPERKNSVITSPFAQQRMHLMRAEHDAILVGRGTFDADNPSLTCRLPGMEKASPRRYVAAGSKGQIPDFDVLHQSTPSAMLTYLAEQGITRVMLEGGPKLAKAFLDEGLVDDIAWFQAPHDLPLVAQSDLQFMGIENLLKSPKFRLDRQEFWSPDRLFLLSRHGEE